MIDQLLDWIQIYPDDSVTSQNANYTIPLMSFIFVIVVHSIHVVYEVMIVYIIDVSFLVHTI